jgi:predicted MFS family arabinose efflux permease
VTSRAQAIRDVIANGNFRRLWAAGGLAGGARWCELVALGIFAYDITGSPTLVALLGVARIAPFALLGVTMGAIADHTDQRKLVIASFLLVLVTGLVMTALALAGAATYTAAFIAAIVSGVFWVTDMPFRRKPMVASLDQQHVPAALSLDVTTSNAMRTLGPLAGGAIYQAAGLAGAYAVATLIYAVCLALAFRTSASPRAPAAGTAPRPSAIGYLLPPPELLRNRRFLIIIGVTLVYNLWCFPLIGMVPVFASKDFGFSPTWVGILTSLEALGSTLGAFALGFVLTQRRLFTIYFLGTLAFLMVLLGLSLWLVPNAAFVAFVLLGLASSCFAATQYTLVYTTAPPEMRGRAAGFLATAIGMGVIGALNAGFLFERFASATAMWIMALEGIAALTLLGLLWRRAQ